MICNDQPCISVYKKVFDDEDMTSIDDDRIEVAATAVKESRRKIYDFFVRRFFSLCRDKTIPWHQSKSPNHHDTNNEPSRVSIVTRLSFLL